MDLAVRYVGREACTPCHAAIARTYSGTGMGRAFYPLDPQTAVEDFTSRNTLEIASERLLYEMTARDGSYWMRQSVLDESGKTLASAEKPMLYVVGSGNHSRAYLTGQDGYLFQMPVCWYPDKPGWELCPGYEDRNSYFTRVVNDSCLFCHNARMPLFPGATGRYSEPFPHGIDCERCHGPGELHVKLWQDPPDPPPDRDDTIVNPVRLSRERRISVCMQCHLGDSEAAESLVRPGRSARDFRPGSRIADFLFVVTVDPPGANKFGLGSQADRLLFSRCYKESGGAIECLTCHDPHVTVYDRSAPPDRFRKACLTCHAETDCRDDRGSRARVGDDCTKCHMRRAEPSDQRFTAFTDHWIRKRIDPPDAAAPDPAAPERASVSLANLLVDERASRAEATINRAVAYYGKRSRGHFVPLISPGEPERLFREALAADPSSAEAWYYLGRLAEKEGRVNEAMGDYREALRLDPRHRSARQFLATALFNQNRAAEAEPLLRTAIAEDPADLAAITELSRLLVTVGREDDAAAHLERGLAINPDHPTLLANRGLLEAKRGRHAEAAEDLRRSAALDPSIAEVWEALAGSLTAAGRSQEAVSPARRAADLRSQVRR